VICPVEVTHLEVGLVLALGVSLGIAAAWFWAVADLLAYDIPHVVAVGEILF
jgi:hypothetical protein